jgi:hypothetical protein
MSLGSKRTTAPGAFGGKSGLTSRVVRETVPLKGVTKPFGFRAAAKINLQKKIKHSIIEVRSLQRMKILLRQKSVLIIGGTCHVLHYH